MLLEVSLDDSPSIVLVNLLRVYFVEVDYLVWEQSCFLAWEFIHLNPCISTYSGMS